LSSAMGVLQHPRVFISYAWKDGAQLAQRFQRDLVAKGIDAWLDRRRLEPGSTWSIEIERAIDACQAMLVLMTSGSYASEICRGEQIRAGREGKRMIPILAQAGADRPVYLEAKQYLDFTSASFYDQHFDELLAVIEGGGGVALDEKYRATRVTYVTAPPSVVNEIERPEALRALRDALFAEHDRQPLALTALAGMGGIGKTVLAHALTRDKVVQDAFPDGVIWITMGREQASDLLPRFREVCKALGDDLQRYDTLPAAINQYKTALAQKAALIVVDDIWRKTDLEPFFADSQRSRLLFTTRDASIARFIGAREHWAELLPLDQARELLAAWAGLDDKLRLPKLNAFIDALIKECGNLPLALSVVGAMLRGATHEEWEDALRLLRRADLTAIADRLPPGQDSFFRAVQVSFAALAPEMQTRYKALAVLLEGTAAPLPILQTLWGVGDAEARRIIRHFVDRSLAQREAETGSIHLHDLQLDYVRAQWADREALQLIHSAERLSSHVIGRDPRQFASQVVGRLLPYVQAVPAVPGLQQFAQSLIAWAPHPWLRPLEAALHPPGTGLVRTLEGHNDGVAAVAVTPDGALAISASDDKTLRVWDLKTGNTLRTLKGHSAGVNAVAVTLDSGCAISASDDRTLKIWDLKTWKEVRTLQGHRWGVNAVAVTPDGGQAISASSDYTLKVWDLKTGNALGALEGHSAGVNAVAVTPDGGQAISASSDHTLKVWDLSKGNVLRTMKGHNNVVTAVAVTPDGGQAVSASNDNTLKVWNLKTGHAVRTLEGHSDAVRAVVLTMEGREAISASWDRTLRVWELATGKGVRTLEGHSGVITGVVVTPDGGQAISAAEDKTLKVWDLKTKKVVRTPEGHSGAINGVAVTPDGGQAVSASSDHTLKVWDLKTGNALRTLEGHRGGVRAVTVAPEGRRAVSASDDGTLRVWDLKTGQALRILRGHKGVVTAVAVTPGGRLAISTSSDQSLRMWDLNTGRVVWTLERQSDWVMAVAVMPEGGQAVSAHWDNTLKVWDLKTRRAVRTLEGHGGGVMAVAVTPDGGHAISASLDRTLRVWDLKTGTAVQTLEGHSGGVTAVAVTEGGQAISASDDQTLRVWDLETGALVTTFTCDAPALCCAFAGPRTIGAGDAGGRVYFLSLEL